MAIISVCPTTRSVCPVNVERQRPQGPLGDTKSDGLKPADGGRERERESYEPSSANRGKPNVESNARQSPAVRRRRLEKRANVEVALGRREDEVQRYRKQHNAHHPAIRCVESKVHPSVSARSSPCPSATVLKLALRSVAHLAAVVVLDSEAMCTIRRSSTLT